MVIDDWVQLNLLLNMYIQYENIHNTTCSNNNKLKRTETLY